MYWCLVRGPIFMETSKLMWMPMKAPSFAEDNTLKSLIRGPFPLPNLLG